MQLKRVSESSTYFKKMKQFQWLLKCRYKWISQMLFLPFQTYY